MAAAQPRPVRSLFRSREMVYVTITMTNEAAHDTIHELGCVGKFHPVDLMISKDNPPKQYIYYKKRIVDCSFWERKLNFFEKELERLKVDVAPLMPSATPPRARGDVLESVAAYVEPREADLRRSLAFQAHNRQQILQLEEQQHVLRVCKDIEMRREYKELEEQSAAMPSVQVRAGRVPAVAGALSTGPDGGDSKESKSSGMERPLLGPGNRSGVGEISQLRNLIAGVVPVDKQPLFQRMVYRVSRGNAICRFVPIAEPIVDPVTNEKCYKAVYYVIMLGQQLHRRTLKLCPLFQADVFDLPDSPAGFQSQMQKISADLIEKRDVLARTESEITKLLSLMASSGGESPLRDWQEVLRSEKSICDVMMKCHFYLTMIGLEGWVPVDDLPLIRRALERAVHGTDHPMPALEVNPPRPIVPPGTPPTYFETNKFTSTFQSIVDTYGVPRYREVNPGLFTIVTFPFLYGMMYGDIGHGVMLLAFALYLLYNEKKFLASARAGKMNEIFGMAFGGRYLLLLMGCFAIYNGTIYNDCLSVPTALYSSGWSHPMNETETLFYYRSSETVYPWGVDFSWYHRANMLEFFNSMKMKLAVVVGVLQMVFGLFLSLVNDIHFGDYLAAWFEFIPQLLFMLCTFGYMIFIIYYKLACDWAGKEDAAPNLIQTMIKMFLGFGAVDDKERLYENQETVQLILVALALVSIPTMLLAKPCLRHYCCKKPRLQPAQDSPAGQGDEHKSAEAAHGDEEHSFSDVMIHQGIHTIEYILSAISNTASYLRLWALSLAHAELAEVFWTKLMFEYGLDLGSPISVFVGFAVWAGATFAVLLCMDALECFLHALRLHWVEFQGKFYGADGIAFVPFTFVLEDQF